jgi:hypothetical protein
MMPITDHQAVIDGDPVPSCVFRGFTLARGLRLACGAHGVDHHIIRACSIHPVLGHIIQS